MLVTCPDCGGGRFEPVRAASTSRNPGDGKAPSGSNPRRAESAVPKSTPAAPKCDICGRPMTAATGRNRCNTCGRDVCGACYVVRERACRYCFGTTLDLDAESSAHGSAGTRTGLKPQKKGKGCLGIVLLLIGLLVLPFVMLRARAAGPEVKTVVSGIAPAATPARTFGQTGCALLFDWVTEDE